MTAYGYIRKSVVHDPARMLSPEMQESAIKKLAEAHHAQGREEAAVGGHEPEDDRRSDGA